MPLVNGSRILARALRMQGIESMFFIMGGPMSDTESFCIQEGMRAIDVRHEQAAAMMAHAWGRVTNRVGVCMAASGPGAVNLVTGVANAWGDASPLLAIGGAAPFGAAHRGVFQECDQLSLFRPITKWAERCTDPRQIPAMVATALREAQSGRRGPAYIDMPADILYATVEEDAVAYPAALMAGALDRPCADAAAVAAAVALLAAAKRPVLISGTGVLWSEASAELQRFAEMAKLPFFTTPQGRGVIPEDHELSFLAARSTAFRESDCLIVVGTRTNYVHGNFLPPRFSADAKLIQVNVDPAEIGWSRPCDAALVGDARAVLEQLVNEGRGRFKADCNREWIAHLRGIHEKGSAAQEARMCSDQLPIHPLRLCKEVRDFLDRDAYLVVDGQEILNFGRQSIPTFEPGHRLNSGTWGTMGVGVPFGIAVKLAHPDKQVLVLEGDGSFGLNGMEMDTAVRHNINVVCVVSLNGGWTADPKGNKPGRNLGYTRYDRMVEALGCHGEYVEDPRLIRPALERAFASGKPALVNVKTDPAARATTAKYSVSST